MAKRQAAQAAAPAAKKAKQADAAAAVVAAPAPSASEPEFKNKEKVLVLSTRGITFRCRSMADWAVTHVHACLNAHQQECVQGRGTGKTVGTHRPHGMFACSHLPAALMAGTAT